MMLTRPNRRMIITDESLLTDSKLPHMQQMSLKVLLLAGSV